MVVGGELIIFRGLACVVSIYMGLRSSVPLLVSALIAFVLCFIVVLLSYDLFLWGMLLGLLYLGGIIVLFSYATILMGAIGTGKTPRARPASLGLLGLTFFVLVLIFCFKVRGLPTGGRFTGGELGHLWVYRSSFIFIAIAVIVGCLFISL